MTFLVNAVESVGGAVLDVVESVGDAVFDVVDWAVDEIVQPVFKVVGNVIESVLDDPIKAIAQVAAIATGNAWALPLIEGADVAISGGDLGDITKAVAISYVAQGVGQQVGRAVGSYVAGAGTAAQYGVSQGSQQAAMLAAQEVGLQTASQIAGRVIGSAAASASVAVITGRDPVQAFVTGGVGAAVPTILGKVPGFTELPPSSQQVIAQAVRTQLAGGDVTAAIIGSAIQTSGIVTDALRAFDPDGTRMTDAQRAIATEVLMGTATAALTGKDVSRAMQNALMQSGVKALGDMVSGGFKSAVDGVSKKYAEAEKVVASVDANIAQQEASVQNYNRVVSELNGRVAEQDRLKSVYDSALAAQRANPNQATTDAANAAARAFDNYVSKLNQDYANTYQPQINKYAGELAKIQEQYGNLEQVYANAMADVGVAADAIKREIAPVIDSSNKAFVQVMDPNFNAEEYRRINKLGANDDPYEHWLSKGQFQGVKTNDKDVAVQAAVDKYETATKEPISPRIREALTRPENQDRDKAIQQYVDVSLKDREANQSFRNGVAKSVLDAYEAEGFSQAQINAKIDSGEAKRYIDGAIQRKQESIAQMQEYTKATAERYGADSTEYKEAYRDTLSAMAEVGGYGVVKDGDSFVLPEAGKLNPDTLRPSANRPDGLWYIDPVTGSLYIEIFGTSPLQLADRDISSLWALGKSAKPPTQGGDSVFGDGSGVSAGLFGGIMPVAIDDKSGDAGAKMYGGGNGFALITYSDGRGAAINTKTQEVIWVSPVDVQKLLSELPEPKAPLPLTPQPNAPTPVRPPATNPIQDATSEIKGKIQSPQEVLEAFKAMGYEPTQEEVSSLIGEKTTEQLQQELTSYVDPRFVTEQEAKDAYAALGINRPTQADILKIVGQYDQADLTGKATENLEAARYNSLLEQIEQLGAQSGVDPAVLEAIKSDLNAQITALGGDVSKLQAGLDSVVTGQADAATKISDLQKNLSDEIQAAKDIGLEGDAAVQAGLDSLAGKVGTNQADLLAQLGTTAADLKTQFAADIAASQEATAAEIADTRTALETAIADAKSSGLEGDAALKAAIEAVAADQQTSAADLLTKLGTTEADLKAELESGLAGVSAEVADTRKALEDAIQAAKDIGLEGDSALQAGIDSVAAELGITKEALLANLGTTEAALRTDIEAGLAGVATSIADTKTALEAAIADAKAAGLEGDAALKAAIEAVASDQQTSAADLLTKLGTTEAGLKADFAAGLAGVSTEVADARKALEDAIQAAKDIGLEGDVALQAGIDSVAAELGITKEALLTQLGTTEATLRTEFAAGITGLETQMREQYDALTTEQKALADALTAQGTTLADAIAAAQESTATQISDLEALTTEQYNTLTDAQKATADALVEQGKTLADAIAEAQQTTAGQITDLEASVNEQYATLTAAQKATADALVAQGTTLADAIEAAKTETAGAIETLSADVQAKYDALTVEQKALADAMAQQGLDLTAAIDLAAQQTQAQITGLGESVDLRINELMQQGQTYQQATQQAIGELTQQNQQLQGLVGTQGRTATQSDIDALAEMVGGQRPVDLTYDVTGDKQVTQADIDFLTQVVSGVRTDYTPPPGSFLGPTGLYGQLAGNEAQRQADVAAQLAREGAAAEAEAERQRQAARANAERQRLGAIRSTLGQGQQQLRQISRQIPQALQQAQTTTAPIYGQMGPYLDLGSPLDFDFFKPSPEKQAATKQQQPTKIATGGYIDDLLVGGMSVDELLNLLR